MLLRRSHFFIIIEEEINKSPSGKQKTKATPFKQFDLKYDVWQVRGGNLKTLSPGPRIPETDQVHGLPMDGPLHGSPGYGLLYRPPSTPPPNKIFKKAKIKISLAACSKKSLVLAKFRALRCENVTDPSSVSGASCIKITGTSHYGDYVMICNDITCTRDWTQVCHIYQG